jgi:hypothetical protein
VDGLDFYWESFLGFGGLPDLWGFLEITGKIEKIGGFQKKGNPENSQKTRAGNPPAT